VFAVIHASGTDSLPNTETSDTTSFERITMDQLESPVVRRGVAYWDMLRGERRFPSREEVHPRDIVLLLKNVVLVRVLDGGADFEFRIVGDARTHTYALSFAGKRLSELRGTWPTYSYSLHGLFGHVAQFGEPVALRGRFSAGFPDVNIAYFETAMLPLGAGDSADHLIGFTASVVNTA
jgi:hypothetical protein